MNAGNILVNLNEEKKTVQPCNWLRLAKDIHQKKDEKKREKKKITGKETSSISYHKIVSCLI